MGEQEVMSGIEVKSFEAPDETRQFVEKGEARIVKLAGGSVGRATMEPGWRWSEHVKPVAGTDSCRSTHLGYVESGRMKIEMDSGEAIEVGPGDVCSIPPGHDAWIIGDEACVLIDFAGMENFARRP